MVIFSRLLIDPVYANTNPLPYERINSLAGWGVRNQFVTLNFAVLPLAPLKNLNIRIENTNATPEIRQVCYWNVIYPFYNFYTITPRNKRYSKIPEFLAPAEPCNAPAGEPQQYFLTFRLPKSGVSEWKGDIVISTGGAVAHKLPFRITVLPFELKQDPNKHFSTYNYQIRDRKHWFYEQA